MATRRQFYGQSTSISNEIARNLHAYADHQTLAELTQNADDAGAKRVAFMLDARTHGTDRLLHHSGSTGRLNELQGPALLAFDSAVFKENDFSGLRAFGRGGKRYDPTKTGKFGLGFNSVYHLTEVPQFVSGEHMVLLDPQYAYLPGLSRAHEPGLQIHLPSEDLHAIADQLTPFHVPAFGCDLERGAGSFNGTLFRFPLRTETQAEQSELRPGKPYTLDNVLQLFADFKQQAAELLLFLNFVECIELWIWEPQAARPNCVFKVESSGGNLDKRAELATWLRSSLDAWTARTGKPWKQTPTALMDILQSIKHPERDIPRTLVQHNIHIYEHGQLVCTTSWWLRHGVGLHRAMAYSRHTTTTPTDRPLWPVGCVAARVSTTWHNHGNRNKYRDNNPHGATDAASKTAREHTVPTPLQGRAFATLPTDVRTGYPVHVNARWCLMDNRQALQTSQAASHKRMSDFNRVLIQDTVAHLWVELLLELKRLNLDAATFYALWPDEKALTQPWSLVTQQFYTRMQKAEACMLMQVPLASRAEPQWRQPGDVYFDDISSGHLIHLDGDKRMQAWRRWAFALTLAFNATRETQSGRPPLLQGIAALSPLERFRTLGRIVARQLRCSGNVVQALAQDGFPITAAPPFVRQNFKAAGVTTQVTTPAAVAGFYRNIALPQPRTPIENAPLPSLRDAGSVAAIVRFCLGERRHGEQQKKTKKKKNQAKGNHCLIGAPLLAMSDNTLAEFGVACHPTYGKALLSESPHVVKVLGPVARSVIAHPAVTAALLAVADEPLLNQLAVGRLDGRRLQTLIEKSLPAHLVAPAVPIEWPQEMESHIDTTQFIAPSREWLESFYAVLAVMVQHGVEKQDILNIFENIPVVPACAHNHVHTGADGEFSTPTEYLATVPVAKACVLRYPRTTEDAAISVSDTVSRVCDVASRCGVRFLLEDFLDARVLQLPFHTFGGSSLITALGEIHTYFHHQQQQQPSPLEQLSHGDVEVVLRFLEQGADTLSDRDLQVLKTLPLFEVDEPRATTASAPPALRGGTREKPSQPAPVTPQQTEHAGSLRQLIPIHDLEAPRELPARAWSEFLSGAKLLKSKTSVCPNLYQRLGIKPLEEAEYYTLYVFPAMPRLTQEQRLRIMRELNNSQRLLEDEAVLRAIRSTAFVRVASGDIVKPGEAYKPYWLFEKVFPQRVVSREDEVREVWLLPFLERVGLITSVTSDVLTLAAREAAAKRDKDVTDAILRFLSFHAETFADDTTLKQQLSSIPFLYPNVPRDEALLPLLRAYDPRAWYAPKEIYIPTNRDAVHLVWSQVPMTMEKDRFITTILQCLEPTPEMVAKHLRFCSELNKEALYKFSAWLHHRDEEFLVAPCYRFFSRLLETEPAEDVRELLRDGELALIVDRTHVDATTGRLRPQVFFVEASCVFDDLPQPGFPPFAYATSMLARSMIEDRLLAAMGVRKSPTLQDLVRWLAKYAERAQGQPLPEETMRHVMRIFAMLETHEATIKAHNVTNHDGFCVLTADRRLMPGKFVVVDDAPWLRHRIDMSSVFPVHPRIASVAKAIGIHGLDQAVEERLHAGFDPRSVRDDKPEIDRQCATWQATLRSRQFRLAVLRIAMHEQQVHPFRQHGGLDDMSAMPEVPGGHGDGGDAVDDDIRSLREKLIHLQAAEITPVTHVESQFFLRSTGNDITLQPRGSPCLLAEVPTESGKPRVMFYLDTSVPRFKRLSALVMTINRFFGSKFHNLQALEKVIESPPDEVEATLDFLHVTKVSADALGEDTRTVEQGELERLVPIGAEELARLRVGTDVVIKQEDGQHVYAVLTGVDHGSGSAHVETPDGSTHAVATSNLFRVMGVEEHARVLRNAAVRHRLQSDAERANGTAEADDGIERSAANVVGENYDETKEQAQAAVRQEFKESLDSEPVRRVKYEPIDPDWREKEEQTVNALKDRYEQLRNELEPEEPGVDELLVENGFSVPMPEDDPRLKDADVEVSTRVRRGYDLVRIANIGGVAIFHARAAAMAPHRLKLFEQCVQVLKEVSDVFAYDARFVTLFYQEQAQSRFIKQKLLYNIWPIEEHARAHGVADVRSDPFAYLYFYGLHIHKLAHFHDIVHGTRHDYYMNELRIEFLEEWIKLLEQKGFDPAALELSELGERCLRHVVF